MNDKVKNILKHIMAISILVIIIVIAIIAMMVGAHYWILFTGLDTTWFFLIIISIIGIRRVIKNRK